MKQKSYKVVNLDDEPALAEEVIAKSGARTVPVIIVKDETGSENITIGWNPGKLAAAIA